MYVDDLMERFPQVDAVLRRGGRFCCTPGYMIRSSVGDDRVLRPGDLRDPQDDGHDRGQYFLTLYLSLELLSLSLYAMDLHFSVTQPDTTGLQ